MHKCLGLLMLLLVSTSSVFASADRQSFGGLGLGLEILSQDGSGTGFYYQAFGGYNFSALVGVGLHIGSAKIGEIATRATDFGGFVQLTDESSGLFGRLYLDGVYASRDGGGTAHGVSGSQTGFAPGVGAGMLIPSAGDFHMAPELTYHIAFLNSPVNLITATFNLIWDF